MKPSDRLENNRPSDCEMNGDDRLEVVSMGF